MAAMRPRSGSPWRATGRIAGQLPDAADVPRTRRMSGVARRARIGMFGIATDRATSGRSHAPFQPSRTRLPGRWSDRPSGSARVRGGVEPPRLSRARGRIEVLCLSRTEHGRDDEGTALPYDGAEAQAARDSAAHAAPLARDLAPHPQIGTDSAQTLLEITQALTNGYRNSSRSATGGWASQRSPSTGARLPMAADLPRAPRAGSSSSCAETRISPTSGCSRRPSGPRSSTSTTSTRPCTAHSSGTSSDWRRASWWPRRSRGFSAHDSRHAVHRAMRSYRERMAEYASMRAIDVYYSSVSVAEHPDLRQQARPSDDRGRGPSAAHHDALHELVEADGAGRREARDRRPAAGHRPSPRSRPIRSSPRAWRTTGPPCRRIAESCWIATRSSTTR